MSLKDDLKRRSHERQRERDAAQVRRTAKREWNTRAEKQLDDVEDKLKAIGDDRLSVHRLSPERLSVSEERGGTIVFEASDADKHLIVLRREGSFAFARSIGILRFLAGR